MSFFDDWKGADSWTDDEIARNGAFIAGRLLNAAGEEYFTHDLAWVFDWTLDFALRFAPEDAAVLIAWTVVAELASELPAAARA